MTLEEVIEKAKLERRTCLNISYCDIEELPDSIGTLTDLTSLDISINFLTELPKSIIDLTNLEYLNVSLNRLDNTSLDLICQLINLEDLDLRSNNLYRLPEKITNLRKLKYLDASSNFLQILPLGFENLVNLKELDLADNKICSLDDFVFPINLEHIYLPSNNISMVSDRHFNHLKESFSVELTDNPLTDLSPFQSLSYLTIVTMFGVSFPPRYWMKFSDWNPEWLLDEDNAEIRRVLIEQVGYEKICEKLGAISLDAWREYELIKIDASVDVEPIFLLKMSCPSTQHIHILRVPPDLSSAEAAITWINHGIHPDEISVQT